MSEPVSQNTERVELACLDFGDQRFGIAVEAVREVVRATAPTPLPEAPEGVEGIVDLRGRILPVVDLAHLLGLQTASASRSRLVVVEVDGLRFGLRVAATVDVLALDASRVEAPPALTSHAGDALVCAVARPAQGPPVLVLALDRLIERVPRSRPQAGVDGPEEAA